MSKFSVSATLLIVLVGIFGAFGLGLYLRPEPAMGDAERAYRLERTAETELNRVRLLVDSSRMHALDGSQCISKNVLPTLTEWAQKCVIPDCAIDVGGKPFVGLSVPKAADKARTPTKTADVIKKPPEKKP